MTTMVTTHGAADCDYLYAHSTVGCYGYHTCCCGLPLQAVLVDSGKVVYECTVRITDLLYERNACSLQVL